MNVNRCGEIHRKVPVVNVVVVRCVPAQTSGVGLICHFKNREEFKNVFFHSPCTPKLGLTN
jgi:hypothetical protein